MKIKKEWSNPYNSFNSYKGLLYRDNFDGIISKKLQAPIEVNVDPVNNCQLDCIWCNGKDIISRDKKVMMTKEHLLEIVEYCANWGVKGICFAGGGEPTLHPDLGLAIKHSVLNKLEPALITNGLFINDQQIRDCAEHCRWIGVSVDAGSAVQFEKLKKVDKFEEVKSNIRKLVEYGAREVTFKFLAFPGWGNWDGVSNTNEIYDACKLAKELGCHAFHFRVMSVAYTKHRKYTWLKIYKQLEKCHYLESDTFKVYTISHKQADDGQKRLRFCKCKASPLLCMFEANGDVSVCIDRKGDPKTRLCSHTYLSDLKDAWGSDKHFELLDKINPEKDCPKCTMTIYQELLNEYEKDSFCVNFP